MFFENSFDAVWTAAFDMKPKSAKGKKEIPEPRGKRVQRNFFSIPFQTDKPRDDLMLFNAFFNSELIVPAKVEASVGTSAYDAMQDELSVFSSIKNNVVFCKGRIDRTQSYRIFPVADERKHTVSKGAKREIFPLSQRFLYDRKQVLKAYLFTR